MLDYEKLGLKVGIEFHQMLDTKEKLFCHCPPELIRENADYIFKRRLRPTASELGEVDPAALFEFKRGRVYVYEHLDGSSCLVEMDEEPPHDINVDALKIALTIALMIGAKPVDEVHVMRKVVIDGSNTTGFQRTALIALGGEVKVDGKRIPIQTICLEEDAARKLEERGKEVVYRLDRLGIPLIEIATAPVISTPEEAEKVALKIGQLLRVTGMVKRGLGTIRQDLNISIKGGAKIEIKGVQKLELISKIVEYEVLRQVNLLKIRDELKKRGVTEEELRAQEIVDVTELFRNTKCKVIKRAISKGGVVLAVKLPKFAGILGWEIQPGRRFGTELADRARFWGGVGGIFHSDELPKYGISQEEVENVLRKLKADKMDAFVLVADRKNKAVEALKAVIVRCIEALQGVPEETRGANPDGTTHYSRPRPGAARMYPETDIRPFRITREFLEEIARNLPELPESKYEKFVKVYGLSEDMAKRMVTSYYLDLFERIVEKYKVPASVVASTFENILISLRREGVPTENISDEKFEELFEMLSKGKISKEAIPNILKFLAENPDKSVRDAVKELGLKTVSTEEIEKIVEQILSQKVDLIRSRRERAFGPLMGLVMRELRGKADGRVVSEILKRRLDEYLRKLD